MTSAVQIAPEEKYLELIFDIGTIFKAEDRNERMVKYLIVMKGTKQAKVFTQSNLRWKS